MKPGSPRSDALRVHDILRSAARVRSYVHGTTRAQFDKDPKTQDAVIRQLELVGEAAKGLSMNFRDAYPVDDWRKIAGMRDKLAHHYWKTDLDLVWEVAKKHVRRLAAALEKKRLRRDKTPAQLDAEITAVLARPKRRKKR